MKRFACRRTLWCNVQQMHDRIAGALALSALADAAGFAHEPHGLAGKIGDPASPLLPLVQPFRESKANPWNLWASKRETRGRRGVVTDDTSFRIHLLEPWLRDTQEVSEPSFRSWLRTAKFAHPVAPRLARILEKTWKAQERNRPYGFFSPGLDTAWGQFLYGSLILHESAPDLESFSRLDPTNSLARFAGAIPDRTVPKKEHEFLDQLRSETRKWEWPFHPDRQWHETVAVLAFAQGDPNRLLRVAHILPGDCDTVGAAAGLLLGRQLGLRVLTDTLGEELALVEAMTRIMLGVSLEQRVQAYMG